MRALDRVKFAVSGTPGTGDVTVGSAESTYQTPAAAGAVDGDELPMLWLDGLAWEISNCVYTASGTSLARTLVASSTGGLLSLSSAAIGSVILTAGFMGGGSVGYDLLYSNSAITNPTTNIDVAVGGYASISVVAHNVTLSSSGFRQILLSVDGGSTFYGTSGDYVWFSDTGAINNTSRIISHATATTAARTIGGDILWTNLSGVPKLGREIGGGRQSLLLASNNPITHIRLNGTAGNMTGGQFYVLGKR